MGEDALVDDRADDGVDDGAEAGTVSGRWAKPTLVGERVVLRPLCGDDVEAVWEMIHDEEGNDLTATTETFERSRIEDWCRSRPDQDGRLDLAIVERATGEFAGEVVLNDHDPATDGCGFRISLRGPAWYGRGLGTEATRLVLEHGFATMGLAHVDLEVLARNPRARTVYERSGFEVTGTRHEDGEEWVDMRCTAPPRRGEVRRVR